MKRRTVGWLLAALALLGLVLLLGYFLRPTANQRSPKATAERVQDQIELAPSDLLTLESRELTQGLPISGTIKAMQSALIKVRVAGELMGLQVREGDRVQAGQILARIDPTEYQRRLLQAQETAEAANAQIEIAQRQFDNNRALVDKGFISKTALDTSLSNLKAAQSTYRASLAGAEVAQKALDDSVLKAPMSGVISARYAQPGERLAIDTKVLEIVDLRQLELEATLSAADSVAVRVGQSAQLSIEGVTQPVRAQVQRINPSTQAGSRSVLVYLQLEAVPGLRQGLFAQGLLGTQRVRVLALPLTSVRTDRAQPYVQFIEAQKVVHRIVQTGARGTLVSQPDAEIWVEVNGLTEGTQVLASSVGLLREGLTIRVTQIEPAK